MQACRQLWYCQFQLLWQTLHYYKKLGLIYGSLPFALVYILVYQAISYLHILSLFGQIYFLYYVSNNIGSVTLLYVKYLTSTLTVKVHAQLVQSIDH